MGMLLDELRNGIRVRHYSRRTEEAYVGWVKRFILFNKKRHPRETGMSEVQTFLTHLAVERHVSASTQNQALSAILFLYRDVLKVNDFNFEMAVHARRPERLPVVLTREEVGVILGEMSGTPRIVAGLLYGAGLRLLECLTLRVKDLEFARNEIVVRDGKGQKDRLWAAAHNRSYVPEKVMCRKSPCLPGDANCCGMPAVSRVYGTAHNYEGPSGVKMLSIFHPRRTQCWKVISNSTTPCNDSVPNQRAATWTILPRCFIQKGTAYGLGRHTCVRLRIWGYG